MIDHWLESRYEAKRIGRPLRCPICDYRFAFRHWVKATRHCPHCHIPLGTSLSYRLTLAIGYLTGAAWIYYRLSFSDSPAWLLMAWPFALAFGFLIRGAILRSFPLKLQAHALGNIWLKLS
jgi:uncharacterized protein (DUF983 family)